MFQNIIFQCLKGHQAQKLCLKQNCKNPSPLCQQEDCICQIHHANCEQFISTEQVIAKLKSKVNHVLNQHDQTLILYTDLIKSIEIDRQEYLSIMTPLDFIEQQEKTLIRLLQLKHTGSITPQLLINTIKSLNGQSIMAKKIAQLQNNQYYLSKTQITKNLQNIKKIWKSKSCNLQYKFSNELNTMNIFTLNEKKTILKINQNNKNDCFVLLDPELSLYNPSKISFRNINTRSDKSQIYCGIGFKTQIIQNNFRWNSNTNRGFYVLDTKQGYYYSHYNNKIQKYQQLVIMSGDIIDITFDPILCFLRFHNRSKNIKPIVIGIQLPKKQQSIHFIISFDSKQGQIQIVSFYT